MPTDFEKAIRKTGYQEGCQESLEYKKTGPNTRAGFSLKATTWP